MESKFSNMNLINSDVSDEIVGDNDSNDNESARATLR